MNTPSRLDSTIVLVSEAMTINALGQAEVRAQVSRGAYLPARLLALHLAAAAAQARARASAAHLSPAEERALAAWAERFDEVLSATVCPRCAP